MTQHVRALALFCAVNNEPWLVQAFPFSGGWNNTKQSLLSRKLARWIVMAGRYYVLPLDYIQHVRPSEELKSTKKSIGSQIPNHQHRSKHQPQFFRSILSSQCGKPMCLTTNIPNYKRHPTKDISAHLLQDIRCFGIGCIITFGDDTQCANPIRIILSGQLDYLQRKKTKPARWAP